MVLNELAIASIRRATHGRHDILEAVLRLVAPLGHRRYLDALRGFDLFLSMWEPRIDAALPAGLRPWFASRSRRVLLRRDLDVLDKGRIVDADVGRVCAQAVSEIELCGTAATFGSIYVLEGSALGSKVIARAASVTLGLDADNGAAYFNGLDGHTAARWTAFQALLEEEVGIEPVRRQQACDAAQQTFDALIATFAGSCRDDVAA